MEKRDLELIEKHLPVDAELKKNVAEHKRLEAILDDFNKQAHLTMEEELEQKGLKN